MISDCLAIEDASLTIFYMILASPRIIRKTKVPIMNELAKVTLGLLELIFKIAFPYVELIDCREKPNNC